MAYDRTKAVNFAKAQLGKSYQWAGTGNPGWDCSGLVKYAVAAGGGPFLPHQSGAQVTTAGVHSVPYTAANKGAILPGDIVFWYGSLAQPTSVTHCGLFIAKISYTGANGSVVHVWQCIAAVDQQYGVYQHRMEWALRPCGFGYIGH